MNQYQACSLEGASGIELVVALYDGIIRFMRQAIDAVEQGNAGQCRIAVRRAMDIVMHLQATLRMDIGGRPAETLAEFYVAIFALMLQGSQANSSEKFKHVIACVNNVRNAWKQVAGATGTKPALSSLTPMAIHHHRDAEPSHRMAETGNASSWTA